VPVAFDVRRLMSPASLRSPILEALDGVLRPLGYRRTASVFSLTLPEVVHLVNLQSSKYSVSGNLEVTVNLGIFAPQLIYPDVREFRKPSIELAHWRQRIGRVSPSNSDQWWKISSIAEAGEVAAEIASHVATFGLQALSAISSLQDLENLWNSGRSPGLTEHERKELLPRLQKARLEARAS
jgi:Domain of unknown function (DUF4304)